MNRLATIFRLTLLLALAGFCIGSTAAPPLNNGPVGTIKSVQLGNLPPESRVTLALIKRGGPFPYPRKDGSTFGNFEKRLPEQPRGYYREYTVPTPGSRDRGARRIVAGSVLIGNVATSGEYYYSHDHYRSFRRIQE